jgi:hypothetical protein
MRRGAPRLFGFLLASIYAAGLLSAPQSARPSHDTAELAAILERCAAYCEKLENSALYFVCKERLREEVFEPVVGQDATPFSLQSKQYQFFKVRTNRTAKNEFVYDYQLVHKAGRLDENRTLIKENGQARQELDAQLKTSGYLFKNIVFGPVGLLGKAWQPQHDYKILREEKVRGRRAVVIKAIPKPGEWTGNLYGTIWVGKDDFGILRIEWVQESIQNFSRIQKYAADAGLKLNVVLTGDFSYEKNGIRFPSEFSLLEVCFDWRGVRIPSYKLSVDYDNYRFFTVETDVKY